MASISTLGAALTATPAGPVASSTRRRADLAELHAAADSGDVNRVRQLLQAGVAVNGPMVPQRCTALHLAAAAGHPDVVQELLANGADVTARHVINGTPLLMALSTPAAAPDSNSAPGQVAVAALLLQAGADVFGPVSLSGQSVAQFSTSRGNSALLQRLLAAGCSINQQDASGRTLLHLAVQRNNMEAVGILLAHGAAVDVANSQNWTALFVAAFLQHTAVVQQLLAAGAAATAVGKTGQTVLHCLAQSPAGPSTAAMGAPQALRDIMPVLINSGADVNAAGRTGWTPLHIAAMYGSTAAATLFLQYGADVGALDISGISCLRFAVASGHADVVQVLLDAGAEAGSALCSAVLARRMPIIKLLLQDKGHPLSFDAVVKGFAYALQEQQQRDADDGAILATLLLHFCFLAQEQRALQPSAAVRYLFSRPAVAAANKDRPALSLALLRSWGQDTAEVDAAQEKDLATVKRAAQQAYLQLAAADRAASSAPQPAATPAAAAAAGAAAVTSAAAASPAAPAAVQPAAAPRRSARLSTRVAATAAAAAPRRSARLRTRVAATAAAAPKCPAAKRRAR